MIQGTLLKIINPGINSKSKLSMPRLGLSVMSAIPETIKGPIKTEDFPMKL